MKRRHLLSAVVCFVVLAAIIVAVNWTRLRVAYHKHSLERIHQQIYAEPTATSGGLVGYGSAKLFDKQDYHCARLAALGYFFHQIYEMENLPDTGEVHSAFWRLVQEEFPNRRYTTLAYPDNVLEVWDLAEHESRWSTFVRKHNVADFVDRFMSDSGKESRQMDEPESAHDAP
jgi:hypothetical protein